MRDPDVRDDHDRATVDAGGRTNGAGGGVTRRSFIQTLGLSPAASAVGARAEQALAAQDEAKARAGAAVLGPDPIKVTLRINGQPMEATIDPATTLMETLRWHFNLTGTK